jgi:hypothetical protein
MLLLYVRLFCTGSRGAGPCLYDDLPVLVPACFSYLHVRCRSLRYETMALDIFAEVRWNNIGNVRTLLAKDPLLIHKKNTVS